MYTNLAIPNSTNQWSYSVKIQTYLRRQTIWCIYNSKAINSLTQVQSVLLQMIKCWNKNDIVIGVFCLFWLAHTHKRVVVVLIPFTSCYWHWGHCSLIQSALVSVSFEVTRFANLASEVIPCCSLTEQSLFQPDVLKWTSSTTTCL